MKLSRWIHGSHFCCVIFYPPVPFSCNGIKNIANKKNAQDGMARGKGEKILVLVVVQADNGKFNRVMKLTTA